MEYRIQLDPIARRQIIRWQLADSLLVDVYLCLHERLARSPTTLLRRDSTWFDSEGMIYEFNLIDPVNRLLVHTFHFQVFYHSDEQTLLLTRGVHVTGEGL